LSGLSAADVHARVLPLPKPLRTFISRRITKAFLQDVHEFLFVPERREVMRESVMSRLRNGGGPFVVVGHSQGSMIAYEALSKLTAEDGIDIDLFVTIGSPLGLKEVQDQLKTLTGQRRLAVPAVVKRWINVSDPIDPVCADKRLANDYRGTNGVDVEDFVRWNADSPRDPHSGSGYLRLHEVRAPVREIVDRELFQRIAPFTIARDLVNDMEMGDHPERHSVLIELRNEWRKDATPAPADEVREAVVQWIKTSIAKAEPPLVFGGL
jgi:pimeloyl-ACP methyl ester carboxylesterase